MVGKKVGENFFLKLMQGGGRFYQTASLTWSNPEAALSRPAEALQRSLKWISRLGEGIRTDMPLAPDTTVFRYLWLFGSPIIMVFSGSNINQSG